MFTRFATPNFIRRYIKRITEKDRPPPEVSKYRRLPTQTAYFHILTSPPLEARFKV